MLVIFMQRWLHSIGSHGVYLVVMILAHQSRRNGVKVDGYVLVYRLTKSGAG